MRELLQDWIRDWQRWSSTERIVALVISALLIGMPAALAFRLP